MKSHLKILNNSTISLVTLVSTNFTFFHFFLSQRTLLILSQSFILVLLFIYSVSSVCVCVCVVDFDNTLITFGQCFNDNSLENYPFFFFKSSIISISTLYHSILFLQTQLKFLKWMSSISST